MTGKRGWIFSLLVSLLLMLPAGRSPARTTDDETVRNGVQSYLEKKNTVGLVVAVVRGEESSVYGFGKTKKGADAAPDKNSLFEIGSVTKAFTGLLFSIAVQRGEIDPDDSLSNYLPPEATGPDLEETNITLEHLVTHRSGLPRLPTNFWQHVESRLDPYAEYKKKHLYAFLSSYKRQKEPGLSYAYSNVGYGLLGHVLARAAGTSYQSLLKKRVLEPLDLRDTTLSPDEDEMKRLVQGYAKSGKPASRWHFDVLRGAGALLSTASDMADFLQVHILPESTDLKKAIRATMKPRAGTGQEDLKMGYGWHLRTVSGEKKTMVWHNGGTGGYRSFVGFIQSESIGIVVLSNSDVPVDGPAVRLLTDLRE